MKKRDKYKLTLVVSKVFPLGWMLSANAATLSIFLRTAE
jgi:hypothetical protein